jgi:S-DNA-T family DNA segregation ATPase FtsK/SpoIIIE
MRKKQNAFVRAAVRAGEPPIVDVRDRTLIYRERIFVPLWVTFVQETLAWAWRLLVRLVRFVVRHPVRTLLLVAVLVLYRRAGWLGLFAVVSGTGLVGGLWRWRWPNSFERWVTRSARSWWRYRRIYRRRWFELMDGCGLVETTDRGEYFPQIARLTSYRDRDHLILTLPAGQVPDDIINSADALAHGLRAWRVTARNLGRGQVILVVHWVDPLADPLAPDLPHHPDDPDDPDDDPDRPARFVITPEGVIRRLAAVVVGRAESGGPWTLALLPGRHLLVSGSTGSGKSGLIWAILWDLADLIRAGWVTVTAFDPKYIELRDLAVTGLGTVHTDVAAMPDELERLVAEMDARCTRIEGRQHVPSLAEPVRLVVIDELATLTALADTKSRRRVEDGLGHLLSRGRAAGFELILTSVEATKDVVRWRGLCSTRVCYRTDDDGAADLVLGDGARDRGAATELISEGTPGIAYTRTEGRRDIARVRTLQITDRHITALTPTAAGDTAPADPDGETSVISLPPTSLRSVS